jgi:hypothetical protein
VDLDVRVDEHEEIAARTTGAGVSCLTRTGSRGGFDDDQLLWC